MNSFTIRCIDCQNFQLSSIEHPMLGGYCKFQPGTLISYCNALQPRNCIVQSLTQQSFKEKMRIDND